MTAEELDAMWLQHRQLEQEAIKANMYPASQREIVKAYSNFGKFVRQYAGNRATIDHALSEWFTTVRSYVRASHAEDFIWEAACVRMHRVSNNIVKLIHEHQTATTRRNRAS